LSSSDEKEVLDRLLAAASAKWGSEKVETMRGSFEAAAQAITVVDAFQVEAGEEPSPIGPPREYKKKTGSSE
jgi:hypothetical protein